MRVERHVAVGSDRRRLSRRQLSIGAMEQDQPGKDEGIPNEIQWRELLDNITSTRENE